jgi:hypothetical protein
MDRAEEEARWQEARELNERHGDDLPKVYAAACAKFAEVADWDGIGRWHDMIYRCEHLRHSPPVIPFAPIALASAGFTDRA